MRRTLSIVLFALGGWLLMTEPVLAFIDFGPGLASTLPLVLLICLVLAAVPLGIAVAVSPGDRRRELGMTVLIAVGAALFAAASAAAVFLDPGFKQLQPAMPPMPNVSIAPVVGIVNLIALTAVGWLLYRRRTGSKVTEQ